MSEPIHLGASRPVPHPDAASAPFFDGLRQGQWRVQSCTACSTGQLGRTRCVACRSPELVWQDGSGEGTIFALATVVANNNEAFNHGRPYNIAIVQLDEGPQIYSNIVGMSGEHLRIGLRVRVVYTALSGGEVVPAFEVIPSEVPA